MTDSELARRLDRLEVELDSPTRRRSGYANDSDIKTLIAVLRAVLARSSSEGTK